MLIELERILGDRRQSKALMASSFDVVHVFFLSLLPATQPFLQRNLSANNNYRILSSIKTQISMPVMGWKLIFQLLYQEFVKRGNLEGDIEEEM